MADIEKITLDKYSSPQFDKSLLRSIQISEGHNYLDAPDNLDRITVQLFDEYSNSIISKTKHISEIEGIIYDAGFLKVDTFSILTRLFNKTSGRYTIKISGHRNYIYDDVAIPDPNVTMDPDSKDSGEVVPTINVHYTEVVPSYIGLSGLEIVELSKSRKEIRLKPAAQNEQSFSDFERFQKPGSIPLAGKYWINDDFNAVPGNPFYYSTDGKYDPLTATVLMMNADYDTHREERGFPFGKGNKDRWNGVSRRDSNGNHVKYMRETPAGRRLESVRDIWPIEIKLPKPGEDGGETVLISTNWMSHEYVGRQAEGEELPESVDTIIFKLAMPAPAGIGPGIKVQIRRPLFVPYTIPVEIDVPYILDELYEQLRGPNLRLDVNKNSSKSTSVKNETDLIGETSGIQSRIKKNIISGSSVIKTNSDYRSYKNFVHFSSAEERLKNFKYKLTRIEHYASKSSAVGTGFSGTDGSVTGSATLLANKLTYDNLHNDIISSFNPYEQYLYYTSHSTETIYGPDGAEIINPATWPKSLDTRTGIGYNLYSVTSSQATAWYASALVSASSWDQQNQSALRNVIPTHIKVDNSNDSYVLFFDMIGEHFDELYLQVKGLEESYTRDESVDVGLSKDLLFDVAKSFGWDLYPGHSTTELWEYALGTDSTGTYQASGSGTTHTYVVKESHSSEDIEKQTWKRIINNLPLLLKTRGTARGVRALLSSYGVPLTILNIDEYGGAPVTRTDDKRAIEKFCYALNLKGDSNVGLKTDHGILNQGTGDSTIDSLTTPGGAHLYRVPSMYEVRVDTAEQGTYAIARGQEHPGAGPRWEVRMEHSASASGWDTAASIAYGSASAYSKYGRFVFEISSSDGQPAISASTAYLPLFDNDWWNVSFGVSEYPYWSSVIPQELIPESQSFTIRCAKAAEHSQGRITHESSATVVGNSSSYSRAYGDVDHVFWGGKGTDPTPGVANFSGSMQEIRAWAEYLSDKAFHQHTLAPTSIVGDTVQMAYNDLLLRLPLGTDNKTYDHSTVFTITSSLPNINNRKWTYSGDGEGAYLTTGSADSFTYSPKSETYFVKVPHTAGPSKHSNKVRIEDNTLRNNQLARDQSFEVSSFDSNPLDSEDVSVVLSPADQIDTDIAMQFGGFDLDDYIGDPRDTYKAEYTSLRDTKNLYFKKYTGGNSVMQFVRYLRSFNKGLFKQIEDMIPARADAIVGIEIRPNLLERHKLNQPISASREMMHYTSSITIRSGSTIGGNVPSTMTDDGSSTYGTLTATIGIGAPPSRQTANSGSSDHYNLYEGSKYLRDVYGETTESAQLTTVLQSRVTARSQEAARIQIPTYNKHNKPEYVGKNWNGNSSTVATTGSGWSTVFEDNFTSFSAFGTKGFPAGNAWTQGDQSDQWRLGYTAGPTPTIVGDGLEIGNDSGNDMQWIQWNKPFPLQPNTLYRMSITFSQSANATIEDDVMFSGFSMFTDDLNDTTYPKGTLINISPSNGNVGNSSAGYFVASNMAISSSFGVPMGTDITVQKYAASHRLNVKYNAKNITTTNLYGINRHISQFGGTIIKGDYVGKHFTHFAPMFLVNYLSDDGISRITHMKVEALPGGYADVTPNYDSSPAQRRLLIDGTQVTSPDFNVGSTETIDGGPVAEYQLVNPNIVQVAPAPGQLGPSSVMLTSPGGNSTGTTSIKTTKGLTTNRTRNVQNKNINVR